VAAATAAAPAPGKQHAAEEEAAAEHTVSSTVDVSSFIPSSVNDKGHVIAFCA
jgi:hypothetical protein